MRICKRISAMIAVVLIIGALCALPVSAATVVIDGDECDLKYGEYSGPHKVVDYGDGTMYDEKFEDYDGHFSYSLYTASQGYAAYDYFHMSYKELPPTYSIHEYLDISTSATNNGAAQLYATSFLTYGSHFREHGGIHAETWDSFCETYRLSNSNYILGEIGGVPALYEISYKRDYVGGTSHQSYVTTNCGYSVSGYIKIDVPDGTLPVECYSIYFHADITLKKMTVLGETFPFETYTEDEYAPLAAEYHAQVGQIWDDMLAEMDASLMALAGGTVTFTRECVIPLTAAKPTEKPGGNVTIDTDADDTPGETDVSVPAAIVVGLLGTLGAVGAAGAVAGASGGDGGGESADDEKRKKKYKMYIRKDFGDCIAYNKPQVTVYARMAEVDENGNEADRPDLTAQIQIFSGGAPVQVEGCTIAGNYMGALVCAEAAQTADRPQSGVVSFLFTGEGGTFRNNVTFRLTGEPYISFPNRGELLEMTLPMLLGDGGAYELPFEVHDFMQKPTELRVNPQGDAPVTCTVEESGNDRYIIKLQNNSTKPDKTQAMASVYAFEIEAENENEYAKNRFEVHLHPEGLSVSLIKMDKGAAQVGCYRDADSPEEGDILPTRFKLELAVAETGEDGVRAAKIVPYAQYTPAFGIMTGTDARTSVLVQKYECPVEPANESRDGLYRFCPKLQLPDPRGMHYAVNQPISAEYSGVSYMLELPVCLIGEPLSPMAGWDAEYKKFINMVRYYGINPDLGAKMRELAENRSTAELRLLTKLVIIEGQAYYLNEGAEFTAIGDRMQFLETGASAVQWIADQALSTLLKIKFGKNKGELISAIYMPFRDIIAGLIAESASSLLIGEEIDYTKYDFYKSIAGMLEDIVMNQLSDAGTVMSIKELGKLAAVLAAFLTISTVKHYNTDLDERTGQPKRCVYDALTGAAQDLTSKALAMLAGEFFEKLISGPLGKKLMSKALHMWLKKMPGFEDLLETQTMKMVPDALKKLFEDTYGGQAEAVIEKGSAQWEAYKDDPERLLIELGVDIFLLVNPAGFVLDKITAVIFDYIFDTAANLAPFELANAPIPTDPPYFKDGEAVI